MNATGWLNETQIATICPEEKLRKALRGGCMTAIISPEGAHVVPPLTEGEGMLIADLDLRLILKRKRMMDSVGHYARPELLQLRLDDRPAVPMQSFAPPGSVLFPLTASGSARDDSNKPDAPAAGTADQRVAVLRSSPG
jgi:aliphatic nitrilase